MNRHPSLRAFSRDHHHGLKLADSLACTGDGGKFPAVPEAARTTVAFWDSDLDGHFADEEAILLPLIDRHSGGSSPEAAETRSQHDALRGLIEAVRSALLRAGSDQESLSSDAMRNLVRRFGEELRAHIRFEEDRLFPAIERIVPEADLLTIPDRLAHGARKAPTRTS